MELIAYLLELLAAIFFSSAIYRLFSIDRTLKLILHELRAQRSGHPELLDELANDADDPKGYWPTKRTLL